MIRRVRRVAMLFAMLALSAAPAAQAALIDFTTGTFECSTASLEPFVNYRDQGVLISSVFFVSNGGANVSCPDGFPNAYRPDLPWSSIGIATGSVLISATSEIVRIDISGSGDFDGDGFAEKYVIPREAPGDPIVLCSILGCDYPLDAVRLPAGESPFNLAGLGLTSIRLVGIYGRDFGVTEIETVPEPLATVLTVLGLAVTTVPTKTVHEAPSALVSPPQLAAGWPVPKLSRLVK